jgi:hypothetical protein
MAMQRNSTRVAGDCAGGRMCAGLLRGGIKARAALGAEAMLAGDSG